MICNSVWKSNISFQFHFRLEKEVEDLWETLSDHAELQDRLKRSSEEIETLRAALLAAQASPPPQPFGFAPPPAYTDLPPPPYPGNFSALSVQAVDAPSYSMSLENTSSLTNALMQDDILEGWESDEEPEYPYVDTEAGIIQLARGLVIMHTHVYTHARVSVFAHP